VPNVLIGGMPAATVGTPHICSFPPPAVHPPTTIIPPGCPTVLIGGYARCAHGRHVRVWRSDCDGRPDRADRRLIMSPAPTTSAKIDFIGAGWSYPLGTDATGGVALVISDRELEQAIRLILSTACGERPDAARVRLPHP
jgi:hypothetical protein